MPTRTPLRLSGFARASRTNTNVHLVTPQTRPRPAHPCLDRLQACVGAAIAETVGVSITQHSMATTRLHSHEPERTSKGPTINPMTRIKKNYCNKNQYYIFWHPQNQAVLLARGSSETVTRCLPIGHRGDSRGHNHRTLIQYRDSEGYRLGRSRSRLYHSLGII